MPLDPSNNPSPAQPVVKPEQRGGGSGSGGACRLPDPAASADNDHQAHRPLAHLGWMLSVRTSRDSSDHIPQVTFSVAGGTPETLRKWVRQATTPSASMVITPSTNESKQHGLNEIAFFGQGRAPVSLLEYRLGPARASITGQGEHADRDGRHSRDTWPQVSCPRSCRVATTILHITHSSQYRGLPRSEGSVRWIA
jgi:hypothetical protein